MVIQNLKMCYYGDPPAKSTLFFNFELRFQKSTLWIIGHGTPYMPHMMPVTEWLESQRLTETQCFRLVT